MFRQVSAAFASSAARIGSRTFASVVPVHTDKAPAAIGPYSQAVKANGFLFVSGMLPLDPKTMKFASETDITINTKQVMDNISHVLSAGNSSFDKVMIAFRF
jgi:2-iminobutanoate/2-iminopropanoate deaminase